MHSRLARTITPAFLFAAVAHAQPAATPAADTIYSGGTIITMNDALPRAEAVAVKGGTIIAVGSKADIDKLRAASTASIDLAGKALLPGFIDGHGHVFTSGVQAASANLLPAPDGEGNSIAKIQELLRA